MGKMRSREELAAIVSSVTSEVILVLILFLFSFSNSPSSSSSSSITSSFHLLLNLLLLFNPSEIAASISLLSHHHPPSLPSPTSIPTPTPTPTPTASPSPSPSHSPSPSRKRKRPLHLHHAHSEQQQPSIPNSPNALLSLPLSDSNSFKSSFRMTPSTFKWLSSLLEPLLECRDPIGSSLNLSPDIRLAIGLYRLATGSPYSDISRLFHVSPSTSRFCTKHLCRVLCTNFRFWVSFPNPSDLQSVSSAFQALTGFPNCCGILDCARFDVLRDDNLKVSIAAQIVVDSQSRILSIMTGSRGDKGDFTLLKSSSLYEDIQAGHILNSPTVYLNGVAIPQYLIGAGGGYPLLPWLMVPFTSPAHASSEDHFNATHQSMRRPALRTLASLRGWGILRCPIQEEINVAVACIGACSILHNVLLMREDYSALSDGMDGYSLRHQSSQYYHDSGLEDCLIEKKAYTIRSALAVRARELHMDSNVKNEENQ